MINVNRPRHLVSLCPCGHNEHIADPDWEHRTAFKVRCPLCDEIEHVERVVLAVDRVERVAKLAIGEGSVVRLGNQQYRIASIAEIRLLDGPLSDRLHANQIVEGGMRLVDLRPEWRHWWREEKIDPQDRTHAIGVSFDCPVHGDSHRVSVDFRNTFDGEQPVKRNNLWTRTGETFETLSLSPSVDYTKWDNGTVRDPTCWHGFVTDGEVR